MNAAHGYANPHFYDLASDHLGSHQPDVRFYLQRASPQLQHFLTDEEVLAMLRNVHRHLEPGGPFLFCAMGAQGP